MHTHMMKWVLVLVVAVVGVGCESGDTTTTTTSSSTTSSAGCVARADKIAADTATFREVQIAAYDALGLGHVGEAEQFFATATALHDRLVPAVDRWLTGCGDEFDPDGDIAASYREMSEEWQQVIVACRQELAPLGFDC